MQAESVGSVMGSFFPANSGEGHKPWTRSQLPRFRGILSSPSTTRHLIANITTSTNSHLGPHLWRHSLPADVPSPPPHAAAAQGPHPPLPSGAISFRATRARAITSEHPGRTTASVVAANTIHLVESTEGGSLSSRLPCPRTFALPLSNPVPALPSRRRNAIEGRPLASSARREAETPARQITSSPSDPDLAATASESMAAPRQDQGHAPPSPPGAGLGINSRSTQPSQPSSPRVDRNVSFDQDSIRRTSSRPRRQSTGERIEELLEVCRLSLSSPFFSRRAGTLLSPRPVNVRESPLLSRERH
ncbi:hypothetical protein B0T11DRAFT_21596 [Plectosphaerella cucumerina]|uniref:Uncharacterized protein n=1 Tax=Plectosphaerella cucumerina TaxID=40658 RepID=A0A8K0TQD9_9PEZI|nr:hypothetical protein B0T11DRAFT_21596 [Plectosphaerella cucumerina]